MKNLKKMIAPVMGVTMVTLMAIVGVITFNNSGINKVSAENGNKLDNSIVSTAIQYCGHTNDNTDEHLSKNGVDVGSAAITQHLNFKYEVYDNDKNSYGGKTLRIWFGRNDGDSHIYNENAAIINGLDNVTFKLYSISDPNHVIVNYNDILGQKFDVRNPLYIDLNSKNTDKGSNSIKFKFSLESDSFGCVSMEKFHEYEAALNTDNVNGNTNAQDAFFNKYPTIDRTKKLYTYGIGSENSDDGFEVVIPDLTVSVKEVDNPQYYTLCKALRGEGNDAGNGNTYIASNVYDQYNSANKDAYLTFLPYCGKAKVSASLDDNELKKLIESAITFVNLMNTESNAGNFNDDYFKFEEVRKDAIQSNRGYYIDEDDKWFLLGNNSCFENGNFNIDKCSYDTSNPVFRSSKDNIFSLKCKYDNSFDKLKQTDASGNYNIKANTEHYYAYNVKNEVSGKYYTYHYTGSGDITISEGNTRKTGSGIAVKTSDELTCKKTCEETVEVNYGPPIASTAGLCFEYEVEVISKVRCSTSTKNITPPDDGTLCSPIPICNDIPQYVHQAGPLEEYESCIDSCDGGKYTKSCSDKCYNKVYGKSGNSSSSSKMAARKNGNNTLRKVAYDEQGASKYEHIGCDGKNLLSFKGYYTRNKINNIYYINWISTGRVASYSRYYRENISEYKKLWNEDESSGCYRDSLGAFYFPNKGFKTARYWSGSVCGDRCYFQGCTSDGVYLNEDELKADYKRNYAIYESAIAACKAAASCENKTAKFKISVDYVTTEVTSEDNKCKEKKHTVDFPIASTSSEDQLTSSEKEDSSSCSGDSYLKTHEKSVILDYNGCYMTCGKGSWYYTKWSFPGSWLNPKKKKVEFKDMTGISGWKYVPNKFCVPLNAKDVNVDYWKYYQAHLDENNVPTYKNGNPYAASYSSLSSSFKPEMNIRAATNDFGNFGWNINVSCFYALYDEIRDNGSSSKTDKCERDTTYRIRTVDLTDLFPSKDGETTKDPSKYSADEDTIPFNWSDKSANSKVQVNGVAANPIAYGKYVQTKGYDIYNDAELEYQFHLTPTVMREFKNDSSCMKSSEYSDNKLSFAASETSGAVSTTVEAYRSKCFRDGGKLTSTVKKLPNTGLLGCNNIHDGKCVTAFSSLG